MSRSGFLRAVGTAVVLLLPIVSVNEVSALEDDQTEWGGESDFDGGSMSVGGTWTGEGASDGNGEPGSSGGAAGAGGAEEVAEGIEDRVLEEFGGGYVDDPNLSPSENAAAREFDDRVREAVDAGITVTFPEVPGGGAPIAINPATLIIISDVQRLVTDAGQVVINPNRTWLYVNKPVYFATDAVAHDRQLTILGLPVTVHLTPVGYTWDPCDGSPAFTTATPGGAWPDGDVSHSYRKAAPGVTVGLTVEWSATFTVQGTTYPVNGTTTATTTSPVFEIREAEAVLTR